MQWSHSRPLTSINTLNHSADVTRQASWRGQIRLSADCTLITRGISEMTQWPSLHLPVCHHRIIRRSSNRRGRLCGIAGTREESKIHGSLLLFVLLCFPSTVITWIKTWLSKDSGPFPPRTFSDKAQEQCVFNALEHYTLQQWGRRSGHIFNCGVIAHTITLYI